MKKRVGGEGRNEMSKLFSKIANFFSSRTLVGVDKAGNHYFTRMEEIDGVVKEKRWVIFKGEHDSTSLPVEWICWLNGQRKKAPTPQEMLELEAYRERVRINVELLKKEEKKKSKGVSLQQRKNTGKVQSPDLESFIQQFPGASLNEKRGTESEDLSEATADDVRSSEEPVGSGESFKPGTWQPPS